MANLITRVLQQLSLRITYKLFIIICLSRTIWKTVLKECLYSYMGTLAYMLNAEYSSASKLPWGLWKERLLCWHRLFLSCVDNGRGSLHSAAKWATQKYWFLSQDRLYYYQQNIQSETKWSKSHRPPSSLGTWVWNKCRRLRLGVWFF